MPHQKHSQQPRPQNPYREQSKQHPPKEPKEQDKRDTPPQAEQRSDTRNSTRSEQKYESQNDNRPHEARQHEQRPRNDGPRNDRRREQHQDIHQNTRQGVRSEPTRESHADTRSHNRNESRNEPRNERSEQHREPQYEARQERPRQEYRPDSRRDGRSEGRDERGGNERSGGHDRRRSGGGGSRSTPHTPDFIPIGGGFDRPEQFAEFVANRKEYEVEKYEPYVPKTPARGSDNIFYNDFDPLYKGARGLAIKILCRLEQSDSYLDKLLEYEMAHSELKPLDRALLTEIVNGVTRWQGRLDWVLTGFYHGEFVKCIMPVKNAMRIALYQIMFLQKIPPFAAVHESVELVKRLKGPRSANLVNAILRNILNNINNIRYPNRHEDASRYFSVYYSHPFWLTKRWHDRYGEQETEALLKVNNERPKITLRLNQMRCKREELLKFLESQEVKYWESTLDKEGLLQVGSLSSVRDWKPFQDGWFTIQDSSAAMVVKLANPQAGQRIYDVCAAPGGKTIGAAERTGDKATILAMDKYGGKLHLIEETAARLGLKSITTQAQDIRHFKTKDLADLVLVDAPCSGLGTLAKKPDIKWKFDLTGFPALVKIQREILSAAARLVKPGGTLVYSTCTIEPEENEKQVEWFLQQFPEFSLDPADEYIPAEICSDGFLRTLPHKHSCDGAFGARLVRKTS
ncbi:MAG: 16S rRNA (cytosine(967)-C(5))-methyltransferase RsmB [Candidatus Kapaibacterium sp.]|nr:MAG: 16S rRNA (cytosine(967)-C(5))-methyltransferase RsmB [Candidatus Kapabacteria bacterium]